MEGFLRGRRSVRERTSCAGEEKKIKDKDCRRRFFHGPRRRCTTKLCPTIGRNPGAVELLRWCTNASMGEWCSHTPTVFAVLNVAFAEPYAHLP
jgi:hypothetical protein